MLTANQGNYSNIKAQNVREANNKNYLGHFLLQLEQRAHRIWALVSPHMGVTGRGLTAAVCTKTMGFSAGKRPLTRELGVECSGSSEAEGSPITQTAGQERESLPGDWTPQIIPPKLALCLIYCFRLSKTRMARSSNAVLSPLSVCVTAQWNGAGTVTEAAIQCSSSKAFPCPGTRSSGTPLYRINLCQLPAALCCQGSPLEVWDLPVPPGQLHAADAVRNRWIQWLCWVGDGDRRSRSFPDWDVSPGMETSKEHSSQQ